jgi:energy-coupling factor transporter ATP-binding protein EcfA2
MAAQGQAALPASVETWLETRPSWLRAAAQGMLATGKRPDDAGIDVLADHCLAEAASSLAKPHPNIAQGLIQAAATGPRLLLRQISDIKGVNAFGPRAELAFSDHLTVVYGANGSGKSGYARLLKHVCGGKAAEPILGDVFSAKNDPVSATIGFSRVTLTGGQPSVSDATEAWRAEQGPLAALASVHVFDSATAIHLGQAASTASHLPRPMRVVQELIDIADRVAARLRQRAEQLVSALPAFPIDCAGTQAATFHQGLTAVTTPAMIQSGCGFTEEQLAERVNLEKALAEADATAAHAKAEVALAQAVTFHSEMEAWAGSFGEGFATSIGAARTSAASARKAAQDYANTFFVGVPLPGVGEETWRRMWNAAAAYGEQWAYPGHAHPNVDEGAKCVFCQQTLDAQARQRLASFADYINNQLESEALDAEKLLAEWVAAVPAPKPPGFWPSLEARIGLQPEAAGFLGQQVDQRLAALRAGDVAVPSVDWGPIQSASAQRVSELTTARDGWAALANPEERKKKEARLCELRGQEWMSTIRVAVTREVERKKKLAQIDDAIRLAQTNALTKLSNQIAEAQVAGGFIERFNDELKRLGGGRIPVRLSYKLEGKGVVSFTIGLDGATGNARSHKVLSEGEQRIVALAAFLADVIGTDRSLPVIFDDPISSLDQTFEEMVATRLVELAQSRQVVVFTHRLSMSVLLEDAAKHPDLKGAVEVEVVAIDRKGTETGVPSTIKVFVQPPKSGFSDMSARIHAAMKLPDEDEQQAKLRTECGNFRLLVERSVEDHLCGKIVVRYRRSIKTNGMLKKLTVISKPDCDLIESMMTKYSAPEHSQSYETPPGDIDAKDFLADIAKMSAWIKEFDGRAAAA